MAKVIEVCKNDKGKIIKYKLEGGTIIDCLDAVIMCKEGKIDNCMTKIARDGQTEYMVSLPDGDPSNNLDNLPEF